MNSHLKNLITHVPNILEKKILDLGSGRGNFLISVAMEGGDIYGLEKNKKYIIEALKKSNKNNLSIKVIEGVAENLPFKDKEFGFINISEVIEHVKNPGLLIKESYRVLKKGGSAYLSVPSRFGINDPHFHLHFVNFLPRKYSDIFINMFGKHKNYHGDAGEQRLKEMHYYKFYDIKRKLEIEGFKVIDIREKKINDKIKNKLLNYLLLVAYKIVRPFYFNTFHLLLKK